MERSPVTGSVSNSGPPGSALSQRLTSFGCGWAVNDLAYFSQLYSPLGMNYATDFYAIHHSFKMDSQIAAESARSERVCDQDDVSAAMPTTTRSLKVHASHELHDFLQKALLEYHQAAAPGNDFVDERMVGSENNAEARARALAISGPNYAEFCAENSKPLLCSSLRNSLLGLVPGHCAMQECPVERFSNLRCQCLVSNDSIKPCIISVAKCGAYLIPANSAFILDDVYAASSHLLHQAMQFDAIFMDPPWANKSVKRKRSYVTEDERKLKQLPLKSLLSSRGLLVIWVTNRKKFVDFVRDELLASYGCKQLATWYWLKVTTRGESVCKFSSDLEFKQPFETIIIACHNEAYEYFRELISDDRKVVISVPNACHSRKPPLFDIIAEYLSLMNKSVGSMLQQPKYLELFARYLNPNTLSVGNEVLKFQHISCFEKAK